MRLSAGGALIVTLMVLELMGCRSGTSYSVDARSKASIIKEINVLMPRDVLSGERINLAVLSPAEYAKVLALPLPNPKTTPPTTTLGEVVETVSQKRLIYLLPPKNGNWFQNTKYAAWAQRGAGAETLGSLLDGYLT